MMKVAIYVRCSATKMHSRTIEAQLERSRVVVRERGWTEAGCFVDTGRLGTTLDRPGMQALLVATKRGEVNAIYSDSMSRLSRSMVDFAALSKQCRAMNVQIFTGDQERSIGS